MFSSQTETFTANGLHVFVESLPPDTSYSVIVKTQPDGQNCEVIGGVGTTPSEGANITNVGLTCVDVTLLHNVQISQGEEHVCLLDNGIVQCFISQDFEVFPDFTTLSNPTAISSGAYNLWALDDSGLQCWDVEQYGVSVVPTLSNPVTVDAQAYHVCAIDDYGVNCWGRNDHGQTDVPVLSNPTIVHAGVDRSCAIDDNDLQCWGLPYGDAYY